jgi:hypothetical protein
MEGDPSAGVRSRDHGRGEPRWRGARARTVRRQERSFEEGPHAYWVVGIQCDVAAPRSANERYALGACGVADVTDASPRPRVEIEGGVDGDPHGK